MVVKGERLVFVWPREASGTGPGLGHGRMDRTGLDLNGESWCIAGVGVVI